MGFWNASGGAREPWAIVSCTYACYKKSSYCPSWLCCFLYELHVKNIKIFKGETIMGTLRKRIPIIVNIAAQVSSLAAFCTELSCRERPSTDMGASTARTKKRRHVQKKKLIVKKPAVRHAPLTISPKKKGQILVGSDCTGLSATKHGLPSHLFSVPACVMKNVLFAVDVWRLGSNKLPRKSLNVSNLKTIFHSLARDGET